MLLLLLPEFFINVGHLLFSIKLLVLAKAFGLWCMHASSLSLSVCLSVFSSDWNKQDQIDETERKKLH